MFKKMLIAIACASLFAFAAEDPVASIQKKDAELQALIKKSNRSAKETERVKSLLNESFDFELLAKKSLSSSDWKAQDEASQKKFVEEFQRMVKNSSAKRLEVYRADSTVYEPAKLKKNGEEASVVAHLWNKGKESVLEYKMSQVNGNWKAWDLVIDDLSTARNYKEQFGQILKTKSFAELIEVISKKADEAEK
ncbi:MULTISPECIES: phospholipid-binding protein MlaC [unclassified Fibrobacter]|uniref:MlaC/ttg2D family ABC transporter substrate-binding protein n=2 Tax=Fibrobacter TaxID=832 RepID=UPI00091933AF|nr:MULTISPECIES: ABC transporter substrate-binding protein [unclassified Fibrobacter]MCQ2101360.1 ABC transporter substrate-binding protein [Fibrobacter sp.]SHL33643.1 phospholipid transport system substrate-binding protein [Fibrobacter sp. UWH5]MDO4948335.1 ABC transporter substrate-binding protein [Fibrobacter sp.]OWV01661.1 toluene tolerance protein [Fibrobacter sp. UWH3]OWV06095.1 toluene tolerance protein [Fibrobacter sp. UWH1]